MYYSTVFFNLYLKLTYFYPVGSRSQLYSIGSSSDCQATADAINAHPDYNGEPKVSCVSKRGVWKCVYVNWLAVGRVTAELVLFFRF